MDPPFLSAEEKRIKPLQQYSSSSGPGNESIWPLMALTRVDLEGFLAGTVESARMDSIFFPIDLHDTRHLTMAIVDISSQMTG